MKNLKNIDVFKSMLLVGTLLGSLPAMADQMDVEAINAMNANLTNVLGNVTGTGSNPQDLSRNQLAAALINYEAAAKVQEYQYNQQLLFMSAPGSIWAMEAGAVVGGSDPATAALTMANTTLSNYFNVPVSGGAASTPPGPLQYFQQMQTFLKSGNTTNLATINAASILQVDNLAKATPNPITQAQAQGFINILTNPYGNSGGSAAILKLRNGGTLSGAEMEQIGTQISQYAIVGVSAGALSDIVARRLPSGSQTQSVMEIMDQYSQQRFTNPAWYNQIGAASDTALLREITHIMAYNAWAQYEQFRVSEQQLALLASMNTVMANMNTVLGSVTASMQAGQAQSQLSASQLQNQLQNNQLNQIKPGNPAP